MVSVVAFGDFHILRPSSEVVAAIRQNAREHLLSRFPPGEYCGAKATNEIVQHQFSFHQNRLRTVVKQLPGYDTLELLLSQYDESTRILHGIGISDPAEREAWSRIEPVFRRAIKHLLEVLCTESYTAWKGLHGSKAVKALETAIVCTESMVHPAQESDLVHSIFPEDCLLSVQSETTGYCSIAITGEHAGYDTRLVTKVRRDRQSRDRFVPPPQFDNHTDRRGA